MLLEIENDSNLVKRNESKKVKSEKTIEKLIIEYSEEQRAEQEGDLKKLSQDIFGEELLCLNNQARTQHNKIVDIVALDRLGNGVFIELKKDFAKRGVETQVLQYLTHYSSYQGLDFLKKVIKEKLTDDAISQVIKEFSTEIKNINEINNKSRVILIAHDFDDTIYSIGEWLNSQGVGFRCIGYQYYEIEQKQFISFSIKFDRSKDGIYRLMNKQTKLLKSKPVKKSKEMPERSPAIFWHNLTPWTQDNREEYWQELSEKGVLLCGFERRLGDRGTEILRNYVKGDIVIASGIGAIGYGIIENPANDDFPIGDEQDKGDLHRNRGGYRLDGEHKLDISWKYTLPLKEAIHRQVFMKQYDKLYHPVQTSSLLGDQEQAKLLLEDIANKANQYGRIW
jgi:hypothetical protein